MMEAVLNTLTMVGANTPAYRALYDQVLILVGEEDQDKLKAALAVAMERSDEQHDRAQGL